MPVFFMTSRLGVQSERISNSAPLFTAASALVSNWLGNRFGEIIFAAVGADLAARL